MLEPPDNALLSIQRQSGELLAHNGAAAALLGALDSAAGLHWARALGCDDVTRLALEPAVQGEGRIYLPAFMLHPPGGPPLTVAGLVAPAVNVSSERLLSLWRVYDDCLETLPRQPAAADVMALFGVDKLQAGKPGGPGGHAAMMLEVRGMLADIVRPDDAVAMPSGSTVLVVLRAVEIDTARDISRALLSHLHRGHGESGVRLCVGLAQIGSEGDAASALLAVNRALLRAYGAGSTQQLRLAHADDLSVLVGAAMHADGAFSALPSVAGHPAVNLQAPVSRPAPPPLQPVERDIEGYVVDNMEGAVDQAMFLADLDVPVAILGPAGTGKMYVARVIHEAAGAAPELLVPIDCREFRSRNDANKRIARELSRGEGRTLVFKSPHLMHTDAQVKLARQISSRTLADVSPPRSLPRMKLVALFPDRLERLIRRNELSPQLASVFAGFPITVPPIRDRKQAVLRWAHKILGQEGARRDRDLKGFTPDAERAMLQYEWPGNISEMRQCISAALDKTDKDWLTPVDLGLFQGIDPDGAPFVAESQPFLELAQSAGDEVDVYVASAIERLDVALAEAVNSMLALNLLKPLGAWLEDDIVLAVLDRYRGDLPRAAEFLHTRSRNISRWLPKIAAREEERSASALWQQPHRLLMEWARESSQLEESPIDLLEGLLRAHVERQAAGMSAAKRAAIMGVSTPTYLKRLRDAGH
ncbi:MAG: sigma 54-interacting transcriptional regulator [Halioglobus sp.]